MASFFFKMASALIMCFVFWKAEGIAVMSIDLGSEWMKVAIVSPGVPMEIALNKESQRKTPVAVAFRDGERTFGESAMSVGVRFPERSYSYVLDVIGKITDNPLVKLFEKRFPYYKIEPSGDRGTVSFKHPEGLSFSPEELIAMILKQAQDIAQNAAGQPIKDAVITVPPYFCQAERRALLQAAQMSGLNVLQLINGNTAVALNYGIFRRRDFNETSTNILFYDMGAGSTVATVVSYQLVKTKDSNDVNPQLSVKGVGFDRTLGGLDMQLRLRDHFGKAFNAGKHTPTDIFNNSRSMAKLFKEAGRVKKVLSANTDHIAQVESLLDDKDFKCHVSRAEFEELCSDLFDRVTKPIDIALESAGMDMDSIDQVILAGSGTRVPKVQQILLDYIKKSELGKNINTDESAALGAAYQAAHLSKGFKVKTFLIKDANIYPIQVESQREYVLEDKSFSQKNVRRTIFSRNNIYPQKKIMTFNRYVKDFEFYVNYGELGFLNDLEIQSLGSLNISKVSVSDIEATLEKHAGESTDIKGVKAHFKLDDNGILQIEQVESVFEKVVEEETKGNEYESTLMKLGNTIGRLFSGSSDDKEREEVLSKEKGEEIADPKNESEISDKKVESKSSINTDETKKNDTAVKKEPKLITVKEPLNALKLSLDLLDLTEQQALESAKKLQRLDDDDRSKLAKEKAKNSLESFVLESGQKLYMEDYELASTEDERNVIRDSLTKVGEWLDYDSSDATTEVFVSKLSELKILTRSLFERVKEHRERPEALNALNEMLNLSDMFLSGAQNMSEEEQIFTDVELKTLEKLIIDTKEWKLESEKEQAQLPLTYAPKLSTKIISEKIGNLDREVKYLLNKARFATPLKKKKMPNETNEEIPLKDEMNDTIIDAETGKSTENYIEQGNEYKDSDLHTAEEVVTAETTSKEDEINDGTISIKQTPVPKAKKKENEHSEL